MDQISASSSKSTNESSSKIELQIGEPLTQSFPHFDPNTYKNKVFVDLNFNLPGNSFLTSISYLLSKTPAGIKPGDKAGITFLVFRPSKQHYSSLSSQEKVKLSLVFLTKIKYYPSQPWIHSLKYYLPEPFLLKKGDLYGCHFSRRALIPFRKSLKRPRGPTLFKSGFELPFHFENPFHHFYSANRGPLSSQSPNFISFAIQANFVPVPLYNSYLKLFAKYHSFPLENPLKHGFRNLNIPSYSTAVDESRIEWHKTILIESLRCPICLYIPVESENCLISSCCNHLFCKTCLLPILSKMNTPTCPMCRAEGPNFKNVNNNLIKSIFDAMLVRCKFPSCPAVLAISQLSDHIKSCDFELIDCPYCEKSILRKTLENHIIHCPQKPQKCQFCKKLIPSVLLSSGVHYELCGGIRIPCPICKTIMQKEELEDHVLRDCPGTVI